MILVATTTVVVDPPRVDKGPDTYPLTWSWSAPWLGRSWDLTDLSSPVKKLRGALGTGQVSPEHWWTSASAIDGATWAGLRVGTGEVFLPILVTGADTADFLVQHQAFMDTLDPRQEGALRVTRPDGEEREISCRYTSGADASIDLDPVMRTQATYGITWTTADPYWRGDPVVADYPYTVDSAAFFPGTPFTIVPTRSTTNATVTNPGDVDASAVWRVTGPFTGFTVGVADSVVAVEHTAAAGEWVEIDLDPRRLTVVDDAGADLWDAVTAFSRSAIPPGEVDLTTMLRGPQIGASVRLSFTPRYRRAW